MKTKENTKNAEESALHTADCSVCAGTVAPSEKEWVVYDAKDHNSLKAGDVVKMTEDPRYENWLMRTSDTTLHHLQGNNDEYVELIQRNSMLLFSKRMEIAKHADQWIDNNGVSNCTLNVVTALHALGYISQNVKVSGPRSTEE